MAQVGATALGLNKHITFTFVAGARIIHETDQDNLGGRASTR